jgi:formylglycine-generating enzyme required for sulfatase activity
VETERVAQGAKPVISPAVKETPAIVPKEVAPQVVTAQNTVAGVTTAPMVAPIAMAQQPVTPAPAAPQSITPKPAAPVKPVIAAFDPERLKTLPLKITNSIHQDLILIRPGKFVMGDASLADAPPHEVTITQPYYMGICEVRQTELQAVLGASPDAPPVPKDFPAPFVTYEEAADFCRRLNDLPTEKEAHRVYRLPTEAEWEYACRAGTTTKFAFGTKLDPQRANFGKDPALASQRPAEGNGEPPPRPEPPQGPRGGRPGGPPGGGQRPEQPRVDARSQHPMEPVGSFSPNAWGLKDMHGSVWEWCSDFYSATAYKDGSAVDPTGPATGEFHVARGGCWSSKADQCASAYRNGKLEVNQREPSFGFRVVCEVAPQ